MIARKKYKLSLFVFRRDQRIFDNTGLIAASKQSEQVLPCFIFDSAQAKENNPYFGANCFQFMIECLHSLDKALRKKGSRLYIFKGEPHKVIAKVAEDIHCQAVFVNRDYTPYSTIRDYNIKKACEQKHIAFHSEEDILLVPIRDLPLGFPKYQKFTPFYNRVVEEKVKPVDKFDDFQFFKGDVPQETQIPDHDYNDQVPLEGGRQEGLKLLNQLPKNYEENRNDINSCNSNLSGYNKFGAISIREFYEAAREEKLIKQLYWRDFYYHVMLNNGYSATQKKYEDIKWDGEYDHLNAWKDGKTGTPIVDAAMRCLARTGMMHNRLRMITASYLVKDLLIDWKEGQQHFANTLMDYDPAQNNGGWQWAASTGTDSQPYFRIFNPQLQSEKFDPNCRFITKWIPQLKGVPCKAIHSWETSHKEYKKIDYPKPVVIHKVQKDKAISMFKSYGTTAVENGGEQEEDKEDKEDERKTEKQKKRAVSKEEPLKKTKYKSR